MCRHASRTSQAMPEIPGRQLEVARGEGGIGRQRGQREVSGGVGRYREALPYSIYSDENQMKTPTKRSAHRFLPLICLVQLSACSSPPPPQVVSKSPTVIDLGHSMAASDPTWTGTPTFERSGTPQMGRIATDEHFGTHLDAPVHFGGEWSVDKIPVDRLVRPGVNISVADSSEDYQITVEDIKQWESVHGAIPEGAIVLFATGWDSRWPDQQRYLNDRDGTKHFPGISAAAAEYLKSLGIVGMGIDTPSVDYGPSAAFETHNVTNPAGIFHIENATNLTALPARGFTVVVAPVNIAGGSGGPTRVFALIP